MTMIGLLVPVPKKIAESGCIKICADANNTTSNHAKWELLAYEFDIERQQQIGEAFAVTKKEVAQWIKEGSSNWQTKDTIPRA